MAYKVCVKKLSSYEKKLKQARHERRMGKKLLAELPQFPTAEQIEEMCNTAIADMNTRVGSILKRDHPEAFRLMGTNLFESFTRFYDVQMLDILQEAMAQCNEELEVIMGLGLLSFAIKSQRAEASPGNTNSEAVTA